MDISFKRLEVMLGTLTVFRAAADEPVLEAFRRLCAALSAGDMAEACAQYAQVYSHLREAGAHGMGDCLAGRLKYTDTAFAKALLTGAADASYEAAAGRDLRILAEAAALSCKELKAALKMLAEAGLDDVVTSLPEWETGEPLSYDDLKAFFLKHGSGVLAQYRAFIWSGGYAVPVLSPDPIRYEQMVGYDWQRRAVYENTRALVRGRYVNNVLLYGDSGTGKSATVKSMLNIGEFGNLALIEISKKSLGELPRLLAELSWRPRKFILFIDDLSFEEGDAGFSPLKVLLEGSLSERPRNVAVYVTSNRRQLVRRYFSDRNELSSEETVEEKTSLADRFGLRLPFFSLNQDEYLTTVEALVRQAGVTMDAEALQKQALQWALEHGSRTPRTARQLTDELAAKRRV